MKCEVDIIETCEAEFTHVAGTGQSVDGKAVKGVSLNIAKGEFVSLIGINGSGKTTFARLLNALLLPTGGVVRIRGLDTRIEEHVPEIRKSTGMVFQNSDNQIIGATVEEDVSFGPENLGMRPEVIRERVSDALRAVGMSEYAGNAPHLLSGGEKQKVSLAGILAMKPECVILDEATVLLDPNGRKEMMELVRKLNREEGMSVLLITHDMEDAAMADRVVVIDSGKIVMTGSPGEVFSEVSMLKTLGLDVPAVTEIFDVLRKEGYDLPAGVTGLEEAVDALNRLVCSRGGVDHSH